jgi:hypothetical protein
MKYNELKLKQVNNNIHKYFYSIGERDYVHSTTIITAFSEIFDPYEISVCLNKMIKTGFVLSDYPSETDYGFVNFDHTVFFIKPYDTVIVSKSVNSLSAYQQKIIALQNLVIEEVKKINHDRNMLSRKLWVNNYLLNNVSDVTQLLIKPGSNTKYYFAEVMFNDYSIWKQYGVPINTV